MRVLGRSQDVKHSIAKLTVIAVGPLPSPRALRSVQYIAGQIKKATLDVVGLSAFGYAFNCLSKDGASCDLFIDKCCGPREPMPQPLETQPCRKSCTRVPPTLHQRKDATRGSDLRRERSKAYTTVASNGVPLLCRRALTLL